MTGLDLNRRLLEALAERDTLKTELDRIAADKAYLFHANIANEWEERFESQERRLEMANEELAKVQAQAGAMRKALEPFAAFAEAFDAKPIRGLDAEEIYGIHGGKYVEGGTAIEWSHMRAAQAALQSDVGAKLTAEHAAQLEHIRGALVSATESARRRGVEQDAARAALAKYGRHLAACPADRVRVWERDICTCGLTAALDPARHPAAGEKGNA